MTTIKMHSRKQGYPNIQKTQTQFIQTSMIIDSHHPSMLQKYGIAYIQKYPTTGPPHLRHRALSKKYN